MVSPALASVLRSGRDLFNAKYAQARRRYPDLDTEALSEFIVSTLDPAVGTADLPEAIRSDAVQSAYDTALEIVGERMLKTPAKSLALRRLWREVLPKALTLPNASVESLIPGLSNAAHHLVNARGVRVNDWLDGLARFTPLCHDGPSLLALGQVLAWRSGLAQYRAGALELLEKLPERLRFECLGVPKTADWSSVSRRLQNDVWFDPSREDAATPSRLREAKRVGAFRGLGGVFVSPPIVAGQGESLFVQSGNDQWLVLADVFGFSLQAATSEEFAEAQRRTTSPDGVWVSPTKIKTLAQELTLDLPGEITSVVTLRETIVVTTNGTHSIGFFAF